MDTYTIIRKSREKRYNQELIAIKLWEGLIIISHVDSLVFVDVETTGLNASMDRIIEIHMLRLENSGQVTEYGTLINPQRPLPARITEITGLTDHDMKDSPIESKVAASIRHFMGNGTPVAHNLQFDLRFLNAL